MTDVSQIKIKGSTYNFKDTAARNAIAALPSPMVFKGTLGTGGTITSLPTASTSTVGHTYKVITAGTYASIAAKVGDIFICSDAPTWVMIPSGDEPSGTVTNIATGVGLTGGPITTSGTISLATSGVTAGTYQGLTVDNYGRVTKAANMGYTTNVGTITGIKMNDVSKGTSGVVDLGKVVTAVTGVKLFTGSITGNGTDVTFTTTHDLNTKDVVVQLFDSSTGEAVLTDIERSTANAVTITFDTAPTTTDNFTVLVLATATLA